MSPLMHARWIVAILIMGGLFLFFDKHPTAKAWAEEHTTLAVLITLTVPILAGWLLI